MSDARAAEAQFYSRYIWCLNPALSVRDLLVRYAEELDRYESLTGWQREESKANLYLFACAIACTSDDYFALRRVTFTPISRRFPQLRPLLSAAQGALNVLQSTFEVCDLKSWRWRQRWNAIVEEVCRLIVCRPETESLHLAALRALAPELLRTRLPAALLKRRMRLPEAFRSQDMAHHDVVTLIQRFCDSFQPEDRPILIVGLRTAGAYFAPLMAEYLKMRNWPRVSWFSIRPKDGTTPWEEQHLRDAAKQNARLLVVDDYPATGNTFRITLQILSRFKIQPEQIAILAPTHAAQPDWPQLAKIDPAIPVFTIHPSDLHKSKSFAPAAVEMLCRDYYAAAGYTDARALTGERVAEINADLAKHSEAGHHVREKRLLEIELSASGREALRKRVLLKSVGWGWLGYHAYIAGTRLQDFVPPVLGLRDGLLFSEWMDPATSNRRAVCDDGMVETLASYVAARSRRLPLTGDCRLDSRTYRWTGSDAILEILRAAYGPYMNRLKMPLLRKQLLKCVTAVPTLIDGKMRPEEWIRTAGATYKSDFEHHNFGGAEVDIVDPAYDLAAAIFEFRLTKADEETLLRVYANESGDASVSDRILLHKILYGTAVMRFSARAAALGKDAEKHNDHCQFARNFLVYAMNDFCAALMTSPRAAQWTESLFFMDLDGVFDQELLGFPHATISGLQSLALLHSAGFSVVLNTGRSVQHVRQYCDAYGVAGGIAEFGAVFVDAAQQREIPLTDDIGAEQFERCRESIRQLPGVFMDPGYEYSIRLYRYKGRGTIGLKPGEIKGLLKDAACPNLTFISRDADSYIVQKRTDKAAAVAFVRKETGNTGVPVTAIGDSQYDIGMLKAAEYAYAPGNCSPLLREMAKKGSCRVLKQRFQNGLLAAVQHRLGKESRLSAADLVKSALVSDQASPLMQMVLKAADRRQAFQLLIALAWWSL